MTSPKPWEPSQVLLQELRANRFTKDVYDEDAPFLIQISPCLTNLSEVLTKRVNYSQVSMVETEIDNVPVRRTFISTERHTKITADSLAERFCLGPERAKQTIRVTTQRGTRSAILPITQRYQADRRFEVKRLNTKFATDTAYAKVKSICGNIRSQVYEIKYHVSAPRRPNENPVEGGIRELKKR
eukprot:scaffold67703_cov46-Attheya_sp.AAC.1